MWTLIAVLVSFAWFVPGTQAQPAGPETVVDAFVRAWNSHDAKAFGDVFSEDAHWVTASGVRVKGRGEIRSFLGKEHLTWARTTTMKAADVEVKSIGPDLAVVLFRWDIGGAADADGKAVGTIRGSTLFVAASQANRWTVVTGQVATAPSARSRAGPASRGLTAFAADRGRCDPEPPRLKRRTLGDQHDRHEAATFLFIT